MKRLMVEIDENLWAAMKAQADAEGRFLRATLADALREYLERKAVWRPAEDPSRRDGAPKKTADELRAETNAKIPGAIGSGRDLLDPAAQRQKERERIDRQNYLRTHPEDDSQDPNF